MKIFISVLVGLLLIVLAGVGYMSFALQPADFPARSESAVRLAAGPWSIGNLESTWVDRRRRTQANGEYPGDAQRTLVGDVWFPAELRSDDASDETSDDDVAATEAAAAEAMPEVSGFPLVVFSHGFTSMRQNSEYLGQHLASHGFVVVAVDYPLTSMAAPGGPMVEDVVNQPGDISFLIDSLIAESAEQGSDLYGKVDGERVGVFGISLGGLTSTLVGFHPDWKDPRIDAVLSIAGPMSFFKPEFFAGFRLPFMMLAGELDVLVPYESNALPVPQKVPGGELVSISGGSHTGFSGRTAWLRWMENTDAVGCWSVKRSIEDGSQETWAGLMGAAEAGIDYDVEDELCKIDPLPETMNVLRQQMITKVVVRAFFERYLSDDPQQVRAAGRFLERDLESELREVDYRRSRLPPPPEPTADDEEDALTDTERRLINLLFEQQSIHTYDKTGTGRR